MYSLENPLNHKYMCLTDIIKTFVLTAYQTIYLSLYLLQNYALYECLAN